MSALNAGGALYFAQGDISKEIKKTKRKKKTLDIMSRNMPPAMLLFRGDIMRMRVVLWMLYVHHVIWRRDWLCELLG